MSFRSNLEKLEKDLWTNGAVSFKPLKTLDDLIYVTYDCQLTDEQKDMIEPAWFSIGRAYLFREDNFPCVIRNRNDESIGFINLKKWLSNLPEDTYSWSYFIDKDQQGKGYGKKAAQLAIRILKAANPDMRIKLATEKANTKAQALYRSLGFHQLPELDGDDLVFGL